MLKNSILVVDDIEKNIQVLGSTLFKQGYDVSYATDGPKALEVARTGEFDLILLDIMMPGMDGFEVCRLLKADEKTKGIPILFLTAKTEQADIIKGLHQGAVDYLTKPFNTTELIARVRTHIALKKAGDAISKHNAELEAKNRELEILLEENRKATEEIKTLKGILPICSACKDVRDDKGYWKQLEAYIEQNSDAVFSHSMCPDCSEKYYGKEAWYIKMNKKKKEQSP